MAASMNVEVIESGNAERPAVRCIAWLVDGGSVRLKL